ncbi:hypothetical protein BaRGS_00029230 [Batillaria attramentaria]|uniref:Uncharacterized protein n=1 Tax=Batillaria attramentaria TaxID=370345 RepID=A0ABD0JXC2_9CAEN
MVLAEDIQLVSSASGNCSLPAVLSPDTLLDVGSGHLPFSVQQNTGCPILTCGCTTQPAKRSVVPLVAAIAARTDNWYVDQHVDQQRLCQFPVRQPNTTHKPTWRPEHVIWGLGANL